MFDSGMKHQKVGADCSYSSYHHDSLRLLFSLSTDTTPMSIRCDQTAPWPLLAAHFSDRGRHIDLRQAFAKDTQRFAHFSQSAPYLFADLSKHLWERDTEAPLLHLSPPFPIHHQPES